MPINIALIARNGGGRGEGVTDDINLKPSINEKTGQTGYIVI